MVAWGRLLKQHQQRLECIISFRVDPRLRRRIDVADVIQEALMAATQRRAEFFAQSSQSLFLWLRWMAGNTLLQLHRHHLGVKMRDARRDHPLGGGGEAPSAEMTRMAIVEHLTAGATGPATAAGREELKSRLNDALAQMNATDREVIALRHFEQLTSTETAQVLGIAERAAAKRYLRALERLREIVSSVGGFTELQP
jgi:RNA polymerase sigma-70 factor (ECF subfamily)